jgi:hypothetical protein
LKRGKGEKVKRRKGEKGVLNFDASFDLNLLSFNLTD